MPNTNSKVTEPNIKDIIKLLNNASEKDIELITRAYEFAKKAHEGYVRYSGEPYFNHVFETAKILAELQAGPSTISAGLLHDVIEDTNITEVEIQKEFGKEILFLIEGVTKLGKLRYNGRDRYIESLRKLFVAMSQDIRVLIIKLCDRLHNMRTLEYVPKHKQLRIANETMKIYAQLAYRLGIRKISRELEDLAFKYIEPEHYEKAFKLVKEKNKEALEKLEKFRKSVQKALFMEGFTTAKTDYRIKHLHSFYRKLERKDYDPENVYDTLAMRVYVPTISDCYKALGIIHGTWRPLPGRIKDYIAFPKPNGYKSLHTTIFTGDGAIVEIQIRTPEMHRESEYGIASHAIYKDAKNNVEENKNLLWIKSLLPAMSKLEEDKDNVIQAKEIPDWIRDMAELQTGAQTDEFAQNMSADFFQRRLFVFTPKGDVVDLPIDSTPIDFAYAIHSDVGDHLASAKIGGKMVSLDKKLKNGDIVDVQTNKNAKPSAKWIDIAKTSMAKRHIKDALGKNPRMKINPRIK
jgi:guanosine-3',5'-bis(diphosphate) 3'-pyrophosphohydrolase